MLLKWNDKYKVGVPAIDKQHEQLFNIANQATLALREPDESKEENIYVILNELYAYAESHFKTEEDFMEQISYEFYEQHKEQHKQFLLKATERVNALATNFDDNMLKEILEFVVDWIMEHICEKDKLMAEAIIEFNK
ncbi:MAG: hypothetical protein ATN36_01685 [Epulopiscium sp. Nele67-Bin005]|nr:MAG: hypothetical protein ATN36_01685 [Epulopiscium sp. Nele67-Bin005]